MEINPRFKPHWFWKLFFWFHILIAPVFIILVVGEELSVLDWVDIGAFFVIITCLYGYVFSKKIGVAKFWQGICLIYPCWAIFYEFIAPYWFHLPQYGEIYDYDPLFIALALFFIVPTSRAFYLYGFSREQLWRS